MCENIDWNVGRLLKKLDDLEIPGKQSIEMRLIMLNRISDVKD